jgi:hypothetical protein
MRDFRAIEEKYGSIHTLKISSVGGLVDQALRLAEHVERRRLTVVAEGQCLSACILIAVASPHSYATPDAVFGFHHTSPIAELTSPAARFGVEALGSQSRAFLRAHNVPDKVLVEASKHGADSVYIVSPKEMVAFGAIREIVPKGSFRTK